MNILRTSGALVRHTLRSGTSSTTSHICKPASRCFYSLQEVLVRRIDRGWREEAATEERGRAASRASRAASTSGLSSKVEPSQRFAAFRARLCLPERCAMPPAFTHAIAQVWHVKNLKFQRTIRWSLVSFEPQLTRLAAVVGNNTGKKPIHCCNI